MNPLRAAIIGMGNIGFGYRDAGNPFFTTHAEAYENNPSTTLVAVADSNTGQLQNSRLKGTYTLYRDYRTLLKKETPDIVSICTPDNTHYDILLEVLKSKNIKGIWCEKPLTLSLVQAKKITAMCEKNHVALLVNFIRRYDAFYHEIKAKLPQLLGAVQTVSAYYSGGIVTTGSHLCDLLVYLFGPCKEVRGVLHASGVAGQLIFGETLMHIIPMNAKAYSILELNIFGQHGRLDIMNKPFARYDYRYTVKEQISQASSPFITKKEEHPFARDIARTYMEAALKDLVSCVRTEREPLSSGRSALDSLEIMEALWYSAHHQGKPVALPFRKRNNKTFS